MSSPRTEPESELRIPEGKHTAFFYGTLMAREILYRVIYGSSNIDYIPEFVALAKNLTIRPAILHNYSRRRVRDNDYPGIIPQKGRTVRGTYVTGLTDHDIGRLDSFEGSEYSKEKVMVVLLDDEGEETGERVETTSYVWCSSLKRLHEEEWDYHEFRKMALHRWADHSEEYEDLDDDVWIPNGHDPTGGRGSEPFRGFVEAKEVENEDEMLKAAV